MYRAEPLSLHAPRLDKEAVELLGSLLQFESKNRIPAKEAMMHSYFHCLGKRIHSLPNSKTLFTQFKLSTIIHSRALCP